MIQLGPGTLYRQGESAVPRVCPICGSREGRVAISTEHEGYRGWLCFNCGYFPGKNPKRSHLNVIVGEMDAQKAEAAGVIWICPRCGRKNRMPPPGIRIMAIVPEWDYCPNCMEPRPKS